jgi:Kef-type K+ transport system membrane component KefB
MLELNLILYLGIALVIGFLLGKATHWLKLTAIIGYIFAGIILGPVLGLVTEDMLGSNAVTITVDITLGLVGFIIGIGFTKRFLKRYGKMSISIATIQSAATLLLIVLGVYLITQDLNLSLVLGAIGLATAPAGTLAAIYMSKGRGKLTRMTIAVVGLDDGIAVIFFVLVLTAVQVSSGKTLELTELIWIPFREIGGAIAIGILIGAILAYLAKYLYHREDVFVLTISFIFITIGLCEAVGASFILACMVLGLMFINISPRMGKTTRANIETILAPIFVLFFAIAGLEIRFDVFTEGVEIALSIIIVYILFRTLGKVLGGSIAGKSVNAPKPIQKYIGFALLSQAGVAIGFAILASNELGDVLTVNELMLGTVVITVITITTIIFEIIGPLGVKYALTEAGEAHD